MDQHDLLGAEQPLADGERPDLVVGNDATGVTDHMGITLGQTQQPVGIETCVHAGNDRNLASGWHRQIALVEVVSLRLGVLKQFVCDRHRGLRM